MIPLSETAAGVAFFVRVVPRAGRTSVAGTRGAALLVRLAAAPVDGAANDALVDLLARVLDRPRRDVVILSGHTARDKRIAVTGLPAAEVQQRLSAILREGC